MNCKSICAWIIVLVIGSVSAAQAAIPSSYQIIRLGPLPANVGSNAYDINEEGQSVGASSPTGFLSTDSTPTLWSFDQPSAPALPANSYATSINAQAQLAGNYFPNGIGGAVQHAYYWNGSTFQDIHPAAGVSSYGLALNDAGAVAGFYSTLNQGDQAFVWQNGISIQLGTLGGQTSRAYANNQSGAVAGGAETDDGFTRAFVWNDSNVSNTADPGEMVQLTDLGMGGAALGINDASQAVGWVLNPQFQRRPALWNSASNLTLLSLPLGKTSAEPLDINNVGQIVGTSGGRALVWSDGAVADLNALIPQDLGWTLLRANAINDNGWIVGNGLLAGNDQAFLLVPVPEPSSMVLLALGAGGIAEAMRKRTRGRSG